MKNNILEPLGIDKKTEKVYRSLLKLTDSTASGVAREAGIVRTSVYHILETLASDGLITSYISRGVKHYVAENPNKLKDLFEQKMLIAERLLPILQKDINNKSSKIKFQIFEGPKGLKSLSEEALNAKDKVIYSIGSSKKILDFVGGHYAFGARRRKRKIFMYSLRVQDDRVMGDPKKFQKVRILPQDLELPGYIIMFDDVVGCILYEGQGVGFLVRSREYAMMIKMIFDILWKMSKNIERK